MFGLAHVDIMPLIYGLVIFIGLWSMWTKLVTGRLVALTLEISIFWLVFALHGGSMAGGFSAAFAALLAGFIFPRYFRSKT